ncbi:MAG: monovalent cation:proton antiporter-2 (CPA2) family protein [Bdellovibrionaceae bacterium]|nr:monovalent cation:proton antiporter-2 (CPA2) family protein [Pseudobdellovibrionaceae bacterium]
MAAEASPNDLLNVVTLLGAAVVMVPLFKRIGLGSVLGYLVAGLLIGPFGLQWFNHPQTILHVAELGVVMFLFIIGLEMRPSHLWSLRREIFGIGTAQILVCTAMLTLLGMAFGFSLAVSFISGMGFVLTSTAIVMQLLGERGDLALPNGQKMVSILLFEDLLIVPLLAIVAFMAPAISEPVEGSKWISVLVGIGSLAVLIVAGIWLLNPLFRLLAMAKAREVMTAAALFVVLGAALLMQVSGLSMAMGAFFAGVLLAESSFRHQIEADIEPFRGILLGLFFIGVGMSLDLNVVSDNRLLIISGVLAMMATKSLCIYVVARVMGSSNAEALDRMTLMAQGGEFAFVLYAAAASAGVIDASVNANMTAIVVLSMALTPLVAIVTKRIFPKQETSKEGLEEANGLSGSVLIIGFGRFGQVLSQLLLARNTDVTIIDSSPDMIRSASRFGFKVYYGDGSRLDVLRASGAQTARAIAVCIDRKEETNRIVELVKSEFPHAKVLARSYDRNHSLTLIKAGVDVQIRELFESAFKFGEATLRELGATEEEISEISDEIRRRDRERLELDLANGAGAGRHLMFGNITKPTPLIEPKRASTALSDETAHAVGTGETR